tara:strand:- start:1878 stop:2315 length:438 start_codon:yes stop_codon:yes gene_type:complete
MKTGQTSTSKQKLTLSAIVIAATIALSVAGYIFLYHPPLDWHEHLEVFEEKWGIGDPSYRSWTGKVKNTGPYPIRSAELIIELKDPSGDVTYEGKKRFIELSDPPMHPGNVKRFSILLKYTKAEKIDDTQTTYHINIDEYQKQWF